ncbi:DUF1992 domain-containing protein [Actinoplanes philippinensis]|uniref:DnaJ homologue subfamily C member 28 conserved domain-containing protein n=1 Tax=Actinoplanes philippinensis TaxID=35752 RepID=A0A1I2KRA7_9ACTN|nr:DUF1992 domain-containing protein [Actinoplanes philippinensis]GIE82107.1 DUF1992 domain-containing protein [Actinoplanes philippinensis]SFF69544.1 protein of unknown function [Actinoplanes philippinensis]
MTDRKPLGMSYESWIDQQITEAAERGDFDNLPGTGKALPPGADDEDWWFRDYLEREEVSADAALPLPLLLRKEADTLDATVHDLPTEEKVRAAVADLNRRITESWRLPAQPGLFVRKVDPEPVVAGWLATRPAPPPPEEPPAPVPVPWWRRLFTQPG